MRKKNILIFSQYFLPGFKAGGPIRSISNLISFTHTFFNYFVITGDRDLNEKESYQAVSFNAWVPKNGYNVFYIKGLAGYSQQVYAIKQHDAVYLNSFFSFWYAIIPCFFSFLMGVRTIIAPRGEFSAGALNIKSKKKRMYIEIFKMFHLHRFVTWHATSEEERLDISKIMGGRIEVLVAPNLSNRGLSDGALDKINQVKSKKIFPLKLIFISRISKKKNLDFALKALLKVNVLIDFSIYGPLEDEVYVKQCQQTIDQLPNNVSAKFLGEVYPDQIGNIFQQQHFFFFPTKGENYGHVIAEALQNGCPVLLSDQHPWGNLAEYKAGWSISLGDADRFVEVMNGWGNLTAESYTSYSQGALEYWKNIYSKDIHRAKDLYLKLFNN